MGTMAGMSSVPTPVPSARRDDTHHEVHPPKVEVFDVPAMINIDPKGYRRVVDGYRTTDFGLYMARAVDGHPHIAYFRSWLLPDLGLRVSRWGAQPGHRFDHDYYIDVVDIDREGDRWRTLDLYLDLLVSTGRDQRVLDVDEVLAAQRAGLIDTEAAERAFGRLHTAVDGIAACGYQVDDWLASQGHPVTWPGLGDTAW